MGLTVVSDAMQSRVKVHKAQLEYARELQGIEKGLRGSYINFQKSKSLVYATQKELAAAEEAARIAQLRYKNGLEIFANLLEKERDLTMAELSLISSTANYNISQAQLAYNMGVIDIKNILGNIE
jgi:outer membrane protein TolC